MAENYGSGMDNKDIVEFLITTVRSFIEERILDKEQRIQLNEKCSDRLAAENRNLDAGTEVRYSDQAVLANLDWGIDALEEAINTSNPETKMARLDHAEKMLQVCAMLNSKQTTAGVPNFYLSAWALLNLAYLWQLRNDVHNAALHLMEMFIVDPFFSRIDFAPELWKSLFLPHMSSVVGWYTQERHSIMMEMIPDSSDLSLTGDFDQLFNESLLLTVRPDQVEKMEKLDQLYGQSLDENTMLYAKYYKDCMNSDSTPGKRVIQMFPIVEPPVIPSHEVSQSIPDYVKFGPILPKSARFSPILKAKDNAETAGLSPILKAEDNAEALRSKSWTSSRSNVTSTTDQNKGDSSNKDQQTKGQACEEDQHSSWSECDLYLRSRDRGLRVLSPGIKMNKDMDARMRGQSRTAKTPKESPTTSSPVGSHRSPAISSPHPGRQIKREPPSLLRLMSSHFREPAISGSPHSYHNSTTDSVDSDGDEIENLKETTVQAQSSGQQLENRYSDKTDEGSQSSIPLSTSEILTPQSRAPKDFVCPITGLIFDDPVTLESGQTYERRAIEEWINRGNTTCPITRQPVSASVLPKTNYVLKRLISSWKEQHPDIVLELSYTDLSKSCLSSPSSGERSLETTPSRSYHLSSCRNKNGTIEQNPQRFRRAVIRPSESHMISKAAIETIKPHISCLCSSEDLAECEAAVLEIARIWQESKINSGLHTYLSSPTVVNGFVEILSASVNRDVLRSTIYILSDITFLDESVGEILTSVDSDFDSLAALLKNGLADAAVLIHLLKPSISQLSAQNLIPTLTNIISSKDDDPDDLQFVISPKDAALALVEQILTGSPESNRSFIAMDIISAGGIPALIKCIDREDGRQSVVTILLHCMRADKSSRNMIADRIELNPVLDLFHSGSDNLRGICIEFFADLVQLSRRSLCKQLLHIIKDEGAFSTMHTLLVYLQISPMDQKPAIATLLLQLDLLIEPRKMSIYREEAVEALIEALRRRDFPACQSMALNAILSLSGHLTSSGKSNVGDWLLNLAGFSQPSNASKKGERPEVHDTGIMEVDKKAAKSWDKKLAFVLCNHEKGMIFKAVRECLKSNSIEVTKSCLVMATWLVHMIFTFPNTGIRDVARKFLLDYFLNALQSSRSLEDKILASLALRAFINDPGALNELSEYAKCIYKCLRKLKRSCTVANHILKALMNLPSINMEELWCSAECFELDSSMSGEVLSLLSARNRIISSHSDGTIKVWDVARRNPRLIHEVREHTKAVTCLHISSSCDKLFSGSLDKTIRVWSIKQEEIRCIQVHDVKEPVFDLIANSDTACFTSQGTGVKVYNWSGLPRHVNFNKHVKCLALRGNKLYCGCTNFSVQSVERTMQEVDITNETSTTFYSGTRKLLGKQTIYSLYIDNDHLFVGGSSVDGVAGKVFSIHRKAVLGSLSTGSDIHRISVNSDFIFTASKCGTIEAWLKQKLTKIASIKTGGEGSSRILSLASDTQGDMLFAGYSDGKIQAWCLE